MSENIMQLLTLVLPVLTAVLTCGGFWQWLQSRSNIEIKDAIKSLKREVDALRKDDEEKEIRGCRRRILRFNDELLNNIDHTKEYFDDILQDTNDYRRYCLQHPDFQNGRAVMAIENIEKTYKHCLENHKFK